MANRRSEAAASPAMLNDTPASLTQTLYDKAAETHLNTTIDQAGLLQLGVIPGNDLNVLMRCINELLSEYLFVLYNQNGVVLWKVLSRESSKKRKTLSHDEAMIYSCIESSGTSGAWRRSIQNKTNLHTSIVTRCLKTLESRSLIKSVMNVKQPTQRIYMLEDLAPSDEMTGGPWYLENGDLDEGFVVVATDAAHQYVVSKSFAFREQKGVKREADAMDVVEDAEGREILPLPAGYKGYPKVGDVKRYLNSSGFFKGLTLDNHAVETLMDVLCWDGKVERVLDGQTFKAVRNRVGDAGMGTGNGLTEAPCGTCEVFDRCEEGGLISASTCKYFGPWLEL